MEKPKILTIHSAQVEEEPGMTTLALDPSALHSPACEHDSYMWWLFIQRGAASVIGNAALLMYPLVRKDSTVIDILCAQAPCSQASDQTEAGLCDDRICKLIFCRGLVLNICTGIASVADPQHIGEDSLWGMSQDTCCSYRTLALPDGLHWYPVFLLRLRTFLFVAERRTRGWTVVDQSSSRQACLPIIDLPVEVPFI